MKDLPLQSSGYSPANCYDGLWEILADHLIDKESTKIVSFGCARGRELLNLAESFQEASIIGIERDP